MEQVFDYLYLIAVVAFISSAWTAYYFIKKNYEKDKDN